MAACPRREVVRTGEVGVYHVWNQPVRGAYLFGEDYSKGKNYEHRRTWCAERLKLLVRCFAIDVVKFAFMANHIHLIVRVMPGVLEAMDDREIARRYLSVFPGYRIYDFNWHEPTEREIDAMLEDEERLTEARNRLGNLSWFMSAFSEYIARRANREDEVQGSFWEKRFGCRDLADEASILICGIYIDLNQIRAGEVKTPEESLQSSIGVRIACRQAYQRQLQNGLGPDEAELRSPEPSWLAPLTLKPDQIGNDIGSQTGQRASDKGVLSITLDRYIELVDWVGRRKRPDKRGAIPQDLAPILERLQINEQEMVEVVDDLPRHFPRLVGTPERIAERAQKVGRKWFHGIERARRLFSRATSEPQAVESGESVAAAADEPEAITQ